MITDVMKTSLYNLQGVAIGEVELDEKIFGVPAKSAVIHQVVIAQQRNARPVLAHTKVKSEVRGGGKKPWKQKGTGRARAGSSRSPLWRGGGVTFGPLKERNFSAKVNKKMKNLALRMILSDKARENALIVVDSLAFPESKTKQLSAALRALPVKNSKTLVAVSQSDQGTIRAAKNLSKVFATSAKSLNVVELLRYHYLMVSQAALAELTVHYAPAAK